MNKSVLKTAVISFLVILVIKAATANAGIIHTFEFDDVSKWDQVRGIVDNDSLSIMFKDSTDFNNVLWSDIEYFQYNLKSGATDKYDNNFITLGLANELFSESNGVVTLLLDRLGVDSYIIGYNADNSMLGQIQTGSISSLYVQYFPYASSGPDVGYLTLYNGLANISFTSTMQVPEPSTFAILALGIAGLMVSRKKSLKP